MDSGRFAPIICAVAVLAVVVGIGAYIKADNTPHDRTTTICSAERTATNNGGEYRVYTADSGTYAMVDSHLGMSRTETATDYGRLKAQLPGTFKITYKHHRVGGFLSWFPNLLSFKKIAPNQAALAACGGGNAGG